MKIGIIGTGLIGGSMALKLKEKGITNFIYGIDNDQQHINKALELNIINEGTDLEQGVKNSDLIIIAIPVDAARKVLPGVLDLISDHQTVMDAGSTKAGIVKAVKDHPKRSRFVAFHPMWGTENSGPQSAIADSFSGKAGVICNKEESAEDALQTVENCGSSGYAHDLHECRRPRYSYRIYFPYFAYYFLCSCQYCIGKGT
jgi:prephenate dehydrogenase